MTWTWAEPFAGAAACTLRLVGGRDLAPPVAWMGGKRRLARAILDAMGVPETPPSRVLLADAGPWGWVWPLDLWQRLAAQPPAEDLHERAAQWLWLQARSASGVPIWWVLHGDARDLVVPPGAWVYLDPPYRGATGYGWDLVRELVLALALRLHEAGAACVAVSEAEPLELEGWHHVDLTREGGKAEWLTLSRPPARLPERQGALFSEGA